LGDAGNDLLVGGGGNDILFGGTGFNVLAGFDIGSTTGKPVAIANQIDRLVHSTGSGGNIFVLSSGGVKMRIQQVETTQGLRAGLHLIKLPINSMEIYSELLLARPHSRELINLVKPQ
jgi:Ca2+-binding RTX toxin-like protein